MDLTKHTLKVCKPFTLNREISYLQNYEDQYRMRTRAGYVCSRPLLGSEEIMTPQTNIQRERQKERGKDGWKEAGKESTIDLSLRPSRGTHRPCGRL